MKTEDRWILSRFNSTTGAVTKLMEDFQFGEAQRQIHDFLWGEYCDWYIELAKIRLQANDTSPLPILVHVLEQSLRLLHPYMPFITEELWQHLKEHTRQNSGESIMIATYPEIDDTTDDPVAEDEVNAIIEIIRAIRNVRAQYKVENQRWIEATIHASEKLYGSITPYTEAVKNLAKADPVNFVKGEPTGAAAENTLILPLAQATVAIPMASMYDAEAEKRRIQKELDQVRRETDRMEARLKDKVFLTKAPEAVVEKERQKLYTLKDKLEKLEQQSARL